MSLSGDWFNEREPLMGSPPPPCKNRFSRREGVMFINSLFSFLVTFCFSLPVQEKPSRYQESSHCQYQLRDVNIFIYICRRLSHTWHLGICVILRKNSLSERSELWGFRRMLLADFRMPSMTDSEAVDKYIYIPERPPDSIFLQTISVFLSPYN